MILFFSHQWLGVNEPDPDGVHYSTILTACDAFDARPEVRSAWHTWHVWRAPCAWARVNVNVNV